MVCIHQRDNEQNGWPREVLVRTVQTNVEYTDLRRTINGKTQVTDGLAALYTIRISIDLYKPMNHLHTLLHPYHTLASHTSLESCFLSRLPAHQSMPEESAQAPYP